MKCLTRVFGMSILLIAAAGCQPAAKQTARNGEPVIEQLDFRWHYANFIDEFVSVDGRVIDASSDRFISTSEGQAYGMWFALLADDKTTFDLMLDWANNNLAAGGLGDQLPGWLWGRKSKTDERNDAQWGLLDKNAASDADVWMAYSLLLAARRWHEPHYAAIGERLAARIIETETLTIGALRVLLPGPHGFTHADYVLLNPSYFTLTLFRGLAILTNDLRWLSVYESSIDLLKLLANEPHGVIPDWLAVDYDGRLIPLTQVADQHQADVTIGSYDAIRTYLWLTWETQYGFEPLLLDQFLAPQQYITQHKYPATHLDRYSGVGEGRSSVGFSAVLLPYLIELAEHGFVSTTLVEDQKNRILSFPKDSYRTHYYDTMLLMFGASAVQCIEFDSDGILELAEKIIDACAI